MTLRFVFWRGVALETSFFEQVYKVVERIPYGMVMSYGQIARTLGRPKGARVVGYAMRCCPENVPWQRVVMVDGSIAVGEFTNKIREMLENEGVIFKADGCVDMKKCRWEF